MEGTYILSDYLPLIKGVIEQLNFPVNQIIPLQTFDKENRCHDWSTQIFKSKEIKKIIIPLSIPTDNPINDEGLKIALHIRLNYELNLNQRLIPIIFLSDFDIDIILKKINFDNDNNPQNLLFTEGVYLSKFDPSEIRLNIENAVSCSPDNYHKNVLNKLKILQKAVIGKHSIANAWGCFKLAQVTGLQQEIFKHEAISDYLKTLYSKYLICFNNAYEEQRFAAFKPLNCAGKKILLIDDQADEGWSVLMKNIFKSAGNDFVFIDSSNYKNNDTKIFHDFDGFYEECKSQIGKDWDLIIIDLRLNPIKEDADNEILAPTEFSGYKLIDEFLKVNEGYQIIISTASNKIWNINTALNRGVKSYYVKESPEFNYTIKETKKHYEIFKNEILKCFERVYLRKIFKDNQKLIGILNSLNYNLNFIEELKNQLNLSYALLSDAKSKEQFAYAYVSLYLVVEIINNEFVIKSDNSQWEITDVGILNAWSFNNGKCIPYTETIVKEETIKITEVIGNKPPEWQKFAGLFFQKWNQSNSNFIRELIFLIKKRNGFVHNDKRILDKTDKFGNLINHDIYNSNGFIKLFELVKQIIEFL
ncbi:MAG: hypothetical protein ACOYOV_05845 [Bacteroidales bacterium]